MRTCSLPVCGVGSVGRALAVEDNVADVGAVLGALGDESAAVRVERETRLLWGWAPGPTSRRKARSSASRSACVWARLRL